MSGAAVISRSGDTVRLRRRAPVAMVAPKHSRASQIPTDQRFSSRTKWTERTRPATRRLTTRNPCVHGLRHSFAVRTLLRRYREGTDPNAQRNHLSTFLGHVGLHSTAVCLTITGELLQKANQRFEAFARPTGREVQP